MKRACVLLVLVPVLLLAADESVSVSLRGKAQSMPHLQPPGGAVDVTVIFLPGDGGWRGEAVSMAKRLLRGAMKSTASTPRNTWRRSLRMERNSREISWQAI